MTFALSETEKVIWHCVLSIYMFKIRILNVRVLLLLYFLLLVDEYFDSGYLILNKLGGLRERRSLAVLKELD